MSFFRRISLYLVFAYLLYSCSSLESEIKLPNFIWITSEDNSKHYLKLFDENGVNTPNIEALAKEGITFKNAFSNAPVCSVARSTLISACYAPRIGAQFHRKLKSVNMPDELKMFPAYLKAAGYYTTNNNKEDYNILKGDEVWSESKKGASWRNRMTDQAFFHVENIGVCHEYQLHFSQEHLASNIQNLNTKDIYVHPYHPNTEVFQYTNAYYREKIVEMDEQVGAVIAELEKDNLIDDTFIFYFSDHGGVLPGSKGYVYEVGLHVPLVVYIPKNFKHLINLEPGTSSDGFINFTDLGATVLNLAGIQIPQGIDGQPFLGKEITSEMLSSRDQSFSYADRFDEKYDMVRAIRKGKYKYIRSFQPFNHDALMNNYRYKQIAYQEWKDLYLKGQLNEAQSRFFQPRPAELLFDIEIDPFETNNLANDENYKNTLIRMQEMLEKQLKKMPDLSFYPEFYLIENAFDNPVAFGQKQKKAIQKYIDIANLQLKDFESVKKKIIYSLGSTDTWERYWALIVCSSFGETAKEMKNLVQKIALTDTENINKVRAAEFLGIIRSSHPSNVMTSSLYAAQNIGEALLILNSITLMKSFHLDYKFNIDITKIPEVIKRDKEVKNRLSFFGLI